MRKISLCVLLVLACVLWFSACATTKSRYYETLPPDVSKADRQLFKQAFEQQKQGRIDEAVKLWKKFLESYPTSFEAHNNLGMVFYANDQVADAITEFELGLALEPSDQKIKDNLIIALNFQATLLTENKQYDDAIINLKRVFELSKKEKKEAVGRRIEWLEDKIFAQVKRSGTLEDYESFIAHYPDSPGNSDEARDQIERLKEEMALIESNKDLGGAPEEPMSFAEMPLRDVEEPAEEVSPPPAPVPEMPIEEEALPEPVVEAAPKPEMQPAPMASPAPVPMAPAPEPQPEPTPPVKKVKIMTRTAPLNVRAKPAFKAKVVFKAPKGEVFPMLEETPRWVLIEYAKGKTGWIYKKFSKVVE